MNLQRHFREIKHLFFPRWDRQDTWRVSSRSRRKVHGHCDPERRVIEIVIQHSDPDERDKLFIHEICHAVAEMSHGKKWQDRMEKVGGVLPVYCGKKSSATSSREVNWRMRTTRSVTPSTKTLT